MKTELDRTYSKGKLKTCYIRKATLVAKREETLKSKLI
jgi:hypothetical protein